MKASYQATGYTAQRVKTRDVQLDDLVYFIGAGMLCPIVEIKWGGTEDVRLTVAYEAHGRQRRGVIYRRFNGVTTIHVRAVPVSNFLPTEVRTA